MSMTNNTLTMPKLQYDIDSRIISEILKDDCIQVPEHQRPEMWKAKHQEALIQSIMNSYPMPNLFLRIAVEDGNIVYWLEDGHQRWITIQKFFKNQLRWSGKLYDDLNEEEKHNFLSYKIGVTIIRGASLEQASDIFQNLQDGVPLSSGQRFHARQNTILVQYVKKRFFTPGMYFHERLTNIFGNFSTDSKTKTKLTNCMALAGGFAYGTNYLSNSYNVLGPMLNEPFDHNAADNLFDQFLSIYESADQIYSCSSHERKQLWPAGYTSAYIIASLIDHPTDTEYWRNKWIGYLVDLRKGTANIELLHYNKPKTRNWNATRWRIGYENIRTPPLQVESSVCTDDESDL